MHKILTRWENSALLESCKIHPCVIADAQERKKSRRKTRKWKKLGLMWRQSFLSYLCLGAEQFIFGLLGVSEERILDHAKHVASAGSPLLSLSSPALRPPLSSSLLVANNLLSLTSLQPPILFISFLRCTTLEELKIYIISSSEAQKNPDDPNSPPE